MAKKRGLEKKVIFTGWLEKKDLWDVYGASDLFVLPSLNEGMPNVILEALGCGLPCFGSHIPGIKDILRYDQLIFDPQDENTLVHKIHKFINDQHFFDEVRGLCQERKKVFEFNWKEKLFETTVAP